MLLYIHTYIHKVLYIAVRIYCNFYLVAVYHPPSIFNVSRSLNNSRNTIANMGKDLNSDVSCRWVQLEK